MDGCDERLGIGGHANFIAPEPMLHLLYRRPLPMEKLEQRNRTRVTFFSVQ